MSGPVKVGPSADGRNRGYTRKLPRIGRRALVREEQMRAFERQDAWDRQGERESVVVVVTPLDREAEMRRRESRELGR